MNTLILRPKTSPIFFLWYGDPWYFHGGQPGTGFNINYCLGSLKHYGASCSGSYIWLPFKKDSYDVLSSCSEPYHLEGSLSVLYSIPDPDLLYLWNFISRNRKVKPYPMPIELGIALNDEKYKLES